MHGPQKADGKVLSPVVNFPQRSDLTIVIATGPAVFIWNGFFYLLYLRQSLINTVDGVAI